MPVQSLPIIRTQLSTDEIRQRLETAARRGKLPGLHAGGHCSFILTDFGRPFEGVMTAVVHEGPEGHITFRTHVKPTMPAVLLIVLLLTVWPGIWLTHSMLTTYFSWYTIETWWWYIPLTAIPIPWVMRSALRKSRATIDAEAPALINKVGEALGAQA